MIAGTFPIFVNMIPTRGAAAPPNPKAETPMIRYQIQNSAVNVSLEVAYCNRVRIVTLSRNHQC